MNCQINKNIWWTHLLTLTHDPYYEHTNQKPSYSDMADVPKCLYLPYTYC